MVLMKTHPAGVGDCPAAFPVPRESGRFLCTRDEGHDGSHMASAGSFIAAVWDAHLAWRIDMTSGQAWWERTGREWVEAPA